MILGKNPWRWFSRTVRTKGPIRPFKIAWNALLDLFWDLRHGTETLSRIERENLETHSENKNRATCYGATRARPLLLSGVTLVLPAMIVVSMVALCHTLFLYYVGSAAVLQIRKDQAEFIGVSLLLLTFVSMMGGMMAAAIGLI